MELTGIIIAVSETRSGVSQRTGNGWMSKEFVIEVPGQYPRKCAFTVFGEDRINQFNIQNGEEVTVQFDIDAREYNGRWYNDFRAYNVIRGQQTSQPAPSASSAPVQPTSDLPFDVPTSNVEDPFNTDDKGDLPF